MAKVEVRRRRKGREITKEVERSKSFTEDEGWPFEIGFQEQVSNHPKQLLLRAVVVSVGEKSK
jgi:hypothetical protein